MEDRAGLRVRGMKSNGKAMARAQLAGLLKADESPLAVVRYGPQTRLSRVNLGLRRRKEQAHTGFDIDAILLVCLHQPVKHCPAMNCPAMDFIAQHYLVQSGADAYNVLRPREIALV